MFGIGTGELLLLLVLALIVLGPERMPRMARDIGRVVGELRRTSDELRDEFLNADKMIKSAIDVPASQPASPPGPVTAQATEPSVPANPDETLFDREMREAKERLQRARDA
jgi:sec-independent protein translocase protein TatB